mgnify:CR=1 FL=1|tara:strand:+ start:997 stop:1848 length:852 start_codon:yes stop_codon:yes gene_type:complete
MIEKEIKLNGGVVFWSLGEGTNAQALEAGLTALGLDTFTAEANTPNGALKIALTKTYGRSGVKIDALPSGDGYVVTYLKGDNQNGVKTLDYEVAFSVEYPTDITGSLIFRSPKTGMVVQPNGHVNAQAIYTNEMSTCARHKVARCLTRIVTHLNGVALRDRGGLYWLPQSKMATFGDVARVVQNAGSNSVYTVRTAHDTESVRAICDALTNEVNSELDTINADIMGGDIKKRAMKSRQERAVNLRSQVAEYESILGTALDSLKDRCDEADTAAATTILAAFGA